MGRCAMTEDVRGTGASDRKADAKRRLAEALRANLRRRKASRSLDDQASGAPSPGDGAGPVDDGQVADRGVADQDAAGRDVTDEDRG